MTQGIPVVEEGDGPPRVECPSCSRKFIETAFAKHIKICAKVFGQKRKVSPATGFPGPCAPLLEGKALRSLFMTARG
jgi:zinc-finger of a C2HC-type